MNIISQSMQGLHSLLGCSANLEGQLKSGKIVLSELSKPKWQKSTVLQEAALQGYPHSQVHPQDKKIFKEILSRDPHYFDSHIFKKPISESIRKDPDLFLSALEHGNPWLIRDAAAELKKDPKMILATLRREQKSLNNGFTVGCILDPDRYASWDFDKEFMEGLRKDTVFMTEANEIRQGASQFALPNADNSSTLATLTAMARGLFA